ncbi:MAG: response regulator [Leptolyngbyaceae cyanobacterium HOT.MB2.61]|jgi:DNA-binding response OmpR family regulator/HPt (histidine-containing phosphotransfer) domain-containing protein|nr:response regulator [Leptolyngbyaceae cyanobacterium HOT.MB2.61]
MRILLVEDDEIISKALEKTLCDQHYAVDVAANGPMGWELANAFTYDLILLDVNLPGLDGIQFCQQLRANRDETPVLLLTARSSSSDKVLGLDAGADDYVVKPFELSELLARIRVLLRRGKACQQVALEWLNLRLDPSICEVTYGDRPLHLTPKEYRLLELFLRNPHRVFSRSAILDHLWSSEEAPSEETVTVHIKDLRQKLRKAGAPSDLIETVYGQGYRLKQTRKEVINPASKSVAKANQTQKVIHQQTKEELTSVWENYQGLNRDRLAILEQAVAEWLENRLKDDQRQRAQAAAHKLTGALGIFGFREASQVAKEVEELFQTEGPLNQQKALYLAELLATLREVMQEPKAGAIDGHQGMGKVNLPPLTACPVPNLITKQSTYSATASFSRPLLLIVDEDTELSNRILDLAETWGFSVLMVPDLLTARNVLRSKPFLRFEGTCNSSIRLPPQHPGSLPDVVLLNFSLASATEDSLVFLANLVNRVPPIPVLFLTEQDSLAYRVKVARLSAHAFLCKPLFPEKVLDAVSRVRSHIQATTAKVMIVDDDPQQLMAMRTLLEPLGLRLTTLEEPLHFWRTLQDVSPDLLVLDINMPHFSGIELCQALRNTPQWGDLPVLFLTVDMDFKTVRRAFAAGADDCISKAIAQSELLTRILNRLERERLLRGMASAIS